MKRSLVLLVLLLLGWAVAPIPARAAPQAPVQAPVSSTVPVTIKINTSRTLQFPDRITRIAIINPRVADVSQVKARRLTLTAQALGQTRVEVVFRNHKVILRVTVVR